MSLTRSTPSRTRPGGENPGRGEDAVPARRGRPTAKRWLAARHARPLRYDFVDLAALDDRSFEALYAEMADVMIDATRSHGEESWAREYWRGRQVKARSGTCAYTARDEGRLVGFMLFSVQDLHGWICVFLQSGFIRPTYQGRGVGFVLCTRVGHRIFWRRPWGRFLLVSELINPVILHGWIARFPRSTPMVPGVFGRHDTGLDALAPRLAAMFFPDNPYDAGNSVLSGRTTPRPPLDTWSGDPRVDRYFAEHMDPATGDSVLYVAAFTRRTVMAAAGEILGTIPRMVGRRVRDRPRNPSASTPTEDT